MRPPPGRDATPLCLAPCGSGRSVLLRELDEEV